MKNFLFSGILVITLVFCFNSCDSNDSNRNDGSINNNSLAGTIWEAFVDPHLYPEPNAGGLRLFFTSNTEWKQTGITSTNVYANGTYTVANNTVTMTSINYWNGYAVFPHVISWVGIIEGNKMTITFEGETVIFIKK